eukprot:gene31120-39048_t
MVNIMNQEPPKLKQEEVPVTRLSTLENIALNAREKTGFWRWGFKAKPKIRRGQSSRVRSGSDPGRSSQILNDVNSKPSPVSVRVSQLSSQSKFGGPSVPCPPTPKRASQHMANPLINPMIASFLDRTDTFQRNAASHKLDKAALNSFHESTNAVMSPQVSSSLSLSNIRPHKLFSKNASDLSQAIRNPMFGASEDDSSPPPTQLEHVPGDEPKRKSLSESIGDAVEKAYTVLRSPTMLPKRLSSTRE